MVGHRKPKASPSERSENYIERVTQMLFGHVHKMVSAVLRPLFRVRPTWPLAIFMSVIQYPNSLEFQRSGFSGFHNAPRNNNNFNPNFEPSGGQQPKAKQELSKVKYTDFVSTSALAPGVRDFEFASGDPVQI